MTIFVGTWDCSSSGVDECDTLLKYHLGTGNGKTVQFGI